MSEGRAARFTAASRIIDEHVAEQGKVPGAILERVRGHYARKAQLELDLDGEGQGRATAETHLDRGPEGISDTNPLVVGAEIAPDSFYSFGTSCAFRQLTAQTFCDRLLHSAVVDAATREALRALFRPTNRIFFGRLGRWGTLGKLVAEWGIIEHVPRDVLVDSWRGGAAPVPPLGTARMTERGAMQRPVFRYGTS